MNISAIANTASAAAPVHGYSVATRRPDEMLPGITFDTGSTYKISFGRTNEEQAAFDYRVSVNHRVTPMRQADRAINVIDQQLSKLDKTIAYQRPGLANAGWDVTIEEGKLKATGKLSDEDRQWLQERLNGDDTLKAAVKSYMQAATTYLETSEENPPYTVGNNAYTSKTVFHNFYEVQKQLEGKISFRELSSTAWSSFKNPRTGEYGDPGGSRGYQSLEILASRLTASDTVVDYEEYFTVGPYEPE